MAHPFHALALSLIQRLPPSLLRAVGRLQFRAPWLHRLILSLAGPVTSRAGTIRHGIGAGLHFDATGGQPGYLFGTSEPQEQALLAEWLKPGAVFYDIGANIGFFSTLAGRLVGNTGAVYAFEPFPESADRCRRNAEGNQFQHVTVFSIAVGRRMESGHLHLAASSTVHHLSQSSEDSIAVEIVGLDEFIPANQLRVPDAVMIDVEGSEIDVLAGMLDLLAKHRPRILCEVHGIGEQFTAFFEERLRPLGYELTTMEGIPPSTPGERYHALLIALRSAADF